MSECESDKVIHPCHYTWLKDAIGVEVIDIARLFDFDLGQVIKYVMRAGRKSEEGYTIREKAIEDLRKAMFYLQDEIALLEAGKGPSLDDHPSGDRRNWVSTKTQQKPSYGLLDEFGDRDYTISDDD